MAANKHKSFSRKDRVSEQVRRELAELIRTELKDPRVGMVSITDVEVTPDYAHAKVYYTVLAAEPEVAQRVLDEKAGWFHSQLFKLLHIHTVPTLRFFHDPHLERGIAMSRLIDQATASDSIRTARKEVDDPTA